MRRLRLKKARKHPLVIRRDKMNTKPQDIVDFIDNALRTAYNFHPFGSDKLVYFPPKYAGQIGFFRSNR